MKNNTLTKIRQKNGQGVTEYIILLALIGVASIGIVQILSKNIRAKFHVASEAIRGHKVDGEQQGEASTARDYDKVDMGDFNKGITQSSER